MGSSDSPDGVHTTHSGDQALIPARVVGPLSPVSSPFTVLSIKSNKRPIMIRLDLYFT